MEAAKDDIETSSEELNKDIKKSGVKIEGEKLADNALTVAGVIDNEENKGKSGKELTKIVDQKIE
jgi:tyrosyl-tRNA synthetase